VLPHQVGISHFNCLFGRPLQQFYRKSGKTRKFQDRMIAVTMIAVECVRASAPQRAGASPPPITRAVLTLNGARAQHRALLASHRSRHQSRREPATQISGFRLLASSGTPASYLRLPFLPAAFLAALAVFFGDFFALFLSAFFGVDELLPPEKMVSQLSEYCFVAPMRTTLIVQLFSEFKK